MESDEDTVDGTPLSNVNVDIFQDQESFSSSSSGNSRSDPSTPGSEDDWCDELSKIAISRKRKSTRPLDETVYNYARAEVGHRQLVQDREPNPPARRVKLTEEAQRVDCLYAKVFCDDEGMEILEDILKCLPNEDLRRASCVTSKFRKLCYTVLRKRYRDAPFILHWKTEENMTVNGFQKSIGRHFDPIWLNGVQTMISFGTMFLPLIQKDFDTVPAIVDYEANFLYASGSQLAATLPVGNTTALNISDSSDFALQTLCIPRNDNLNFVCATIPICGEDNDGTLEALVGKYFATRDELVRHQQLIKWFLILNCLGDDKLTEGFTDAYISGGNADWQLGGIMASVERVVSNSLQIDRVCLSAVMAIHGSSTVTTATYGFSLRTRRIHDTIELVAREFFRNAAKSFVIMVYRSFVTKESLAQLKQALGDVVLIGIQTDHPISFMGTFIDEDYEVASRCTLMSSPELDVAVAIGFFKY